MQKGFNVLIQRRQFAKWLNSHKKHMFLVELIKLHLMIVFVNFASFRVMSGYAWS